MPLGRLSFLAILASPGYKVGGFAACFFSNFCDNILCVDATALMYVRCTCTSQHLRGNDMAAAVQRVVVQASTQDKKAISAKAKKLDLPISELMRRGAFAYESPDCAAALRAFADAAKDAADRLGVAIDDALDFIEASNRRIAAMESKASKSHARKGA
jgi:hypothetical protein